MTETVAERNARLWWEDQIRRAREFAAKVEKARAVQGDECETCEENEECCC